ncbi:ATP-binding protein [Lysobacter tyrosinilyticus]
MRHGVTLFVFWLGACLFPALAYAANPPTIEITRAEAAPAGWYSWTPPVNGWTDVQLPDSWDTRWPNHDGVVWYRVRWTQADARKPVSLLIDYTHLAAAVYVNGAMIDRDPKLTEPLTRGWITARYFVVGPPWLHAGENVLLVRVSGLSSHEPGMGTVFVGHPQNMRKQYEQDTFKRLHIKLINLAISAALGTIFLLIWLLRRRETTFGWFALFELTGSLYRYNLIVEDPWPFTSTDGWEAFVGAMKLASCVSWTVFLFRYGGRRYRRIERGIWLGAVAVLAAALIVPHWTGAHLDGPSDVASDVLFAGSIAWFMWRVARVRRVDYQLLAVCLIIPMLASIYGFMSWFGWAPSTQLLRLSQILTSLGIMFALAYRFVTNMRRVEAFNIKLRSEVDSATRKLGETLAREHAMALAKGRADERLQLTRDLHDGFGGTLVGAIAMLEQTPGETSKSQIVDLLKQMRDDLRLVIDSTTRENVELTELLAPLRYRSSQLLEAVGIESRWHLQALDGIELEGARSLDLLRLVQEALTNIFKHSGASRVEVYLGRKESEIELHVQDDGKGLWRAPGAMAGTGGAGFASMRMRALRLQGDLRIESTSSGTRLQMTFPIRASRRPSPN